MTKSAPSTSGGIHPTAIVHSGAQLGSGVTVGPYAVIDDKVTLGKHCVVEVGVRIYAFTSVGEGCHFFPYSSIGSTPQDLKFGGEESQLILGDHNTIREFCTLNRGTENGGGITRLGDHNLLMAYSHVAHDCLIGNHNILANAATLAGHVSIEDHATIGAYSGIHQFCRVGRHAFIGGYSVVTQDALPFVKSVGNRAKAYGINTVGLDRKGFSADSITKLKDAYRLLCHSKKNTSQALEAIRESITGCPEVDYLVKFIESSERGVIKA